MKKGEHKKAVEKYTQSLSQDPTEVTTYTNRYEMPQKIVIMLPNIRVHVAMENLEIWSFITEFEFLGLEKSWTWFDNI